MKRIILGIALGCSLLGCATTESPAPQEKIYFTSQQEGCILLYNMKSGAFEKVVGGEACQKQYPACSTFKVPLAVMAFDSGALKDENVTLKWDGKMDMRPEVNHDHNAKTWMRDSVVWFSQRITPKIGSRKLQKYLDQFSYGNRDMKGGLTQAWLVSPGSAAPALKISAYEQVDFMKKLWTDQLPTSPRSQRLAREITFLENSPNGFALSGKTGSNFFDSDHKVRLGWFISHLQKGEQEYIIVTGFRDLGPTEEKGYGGLKAKEVTKLFLADQGLW